ncbi:cysteine hydrolase family protein [Fodinicola feengrottensis]|nr:isochorismatase family protein [Fodinicola feengrottensis]
MTTSALLVMDVQKAITAHVSDRTYLPRLARAVGSAREAGIPVIHVVIGFRTGHPEAHAR